MNETANRTRASLVRRTGIGIGVARFARRRCFVSGVETARKALEPDFAIELWDSLQTWEGEPEPYETRLPIMCACA